MSVEKSYLLFVVVDWNHDIRPVLNLGLLGLGLD